MITDQDKQFESCLFNELSKILGLQKNRTTAYHPQANGMIERWHRTLKAAIMYRQDQQWTKALPWVLLGLRTTLREDLQTSSAELVYGKSLRCLHEFLTPSKIHQQTEFAARFKQHFEEIRPVPALRRTGQGTFIFKELASCEFVFIRVDAVRESL